MKNIHLIYDYLEPKPINRKKEFKEIHIKEKSINSKVLLFIASRFKYLLKYRLLKYKVVLRFDYFEFADKITYLILDALLYDLLSKTNFEIYVEVECTPEERIQSLGFESTALYRTGVKTGSHINRKVFLEEYKKFIVNKNNFRKLLSREELDKSVTESIIFTDVANALKICSDNEEWIDTISEVVSELICNVSSHTKGDCLLDINFSDTIEGKQPDDLGKYVLVNIAVINFSENNLFDQIKYNIKNKKYEKDDALYKKIYESYNTHKDFFDDKYDENHFFMITAFQNHVTTRDLKSGSGGTGLTRLIQSLIGMAKEDYSYTLSGKNILFFINEYLNISDDKFIGFNKENDYFNFRPGVEVTNNSSIYIPGTIHNLLLIKES